MTQKLRYAVAAAVALCVAGTVAHAAPISSAMTQLKGVAQDASPIDSVNYRRCWWHNGHRHCRWYGGYPYYSSYYYDEAYALPYVGFSILGASRFFGGGRHFSGGHFRGHRR